jgi:pimeloyl-ACP methyl ester carboxylesterase
VTVRLATQSWGDGAHQARGPDGRDGDDSGPAAPLALLIHGVTSSSRTWWRVAPELVQRGYRVLAVDLRGHGSSPRVGEALALGDLTADVLATLRADADRPVPDGQRPSRTAERSAGSASQGSAGVGHGSGEVGEGSGGAGEGSGGGLGPAGTGGGAAIDLLVGHSLGALVALDLLARVPGLARRLVLEEPPGPTALDSTAMAEGIEAEGRRARAEPEAMRRELVASNPAWDPQEVDRRLTDLAACDSEAVAAGLRGTTAFDLLGLAQAIRIPTLLVVGLESLGSALVGPDRKALVDALGGRVDFEVLDAGHNLHREAFAHFMDVLDRWLEATARVGQG